MPNLVIDIHVVIEPNVVICHIVSPRVFVRLLPQSQIFHFPLDGVSVLFHIKPFRVRSSRMHNFIKIQILNFFMRVQKLVLSNNVQSLSVVSIGLVLMLVVLKI